MHLVRCLYYLHQWCTDKKISDNEIYLLIKYIKSVLWRVAKRLSYIEEARCLKVKHSSLLTVFWKMSVVPQNNKISWSVPACQYERPSNVSTFKYVTKHKYFNSSARSLTFVMPLKQQGLAKGNSGNKMYISFMSGKFVWERLVVTNMWLIPLHLHVKHLLLFSDFDKNWNWPAKCPDMKMRIPWESVSQLAHWTAERNTAQFDVHNVHVSVHCTIFVNDDQQSLLFHRAR